MKPLVSILIPAYNAEKWIGDTIRSALNQTWSRKEIIIVNDGSADNTLAIARKLESGYLKVISQANRGASAARNKALEHAQGDYIQWLDADDLLATDKISEQMKFAERGQTNLTLFSSSFGTFHWRREKARFVPNSLWQDLPPVDYMIKIFSEKLWMIPAAWLVSRKMTEMAGPWDERLSLNDDGEYFCRVVAACESVKFVREARCYYRQSGFSQLSRTCSEKSRESLFLSLALSIRHLRSLEESERTRRAGLILLQSYQSYFYFDDNAALREKISALAHELGGELKPPKRTRKENLMFKLFGMKKGRQFIRSLRKLRFATAVKWDEMLYRINK
jgi:glycosyltransferase involved in cell wall biosynthesis